jgi:hypothetical protein
LVKNVRKAAFRIMVRKIMDDQKKMDFITSTDVVANDGVIN